MPEIYINPRYNPVSAPVSEAISAADDLTPLDFHHTLPDYAPTPLLEAPELAQKLGIGRLWIKDESSRLGLPAFKMLGASWATYRGLVDWLGMSPAAVPSLEALKSALAGSVRPLPGLSTATDGNHGRAVARMAKLLGLPAKIYIPQGTAHARITAIAAEGAQVVMVDGTYDEAVMLSAREAGENTLVISDTSWEGYETTPRRVIDGYGTIFAECDEQFMEHGQPSPDVVFVQIGVGALASAVISHYQGKGTRIIGVEPTKAACVLESMKAGEITHIPGPHDSIMAGLNCGTPSMLAFPLMLSGLAGVVAVEDSYAEDAMRLLAQVGMVAGETGAAGLAGLLAIHEQAAYAPFQIDSQASVLLLITESSTDPVSYARILGSVV